MTFSSNHISFFALFLILLTSINASFTLAAPSKNPKPILITQELITSICSKTKNPSLCKNNLDYLQGKTLPPNAVDFLGKASLNMALSQANRIADVIWRRYTNTLSAEKVIRERYHNCFTIYSVYVNSQLKNAVDYMTGGKAKSVKTAITSVVKRVGSCDKELMKRPSQMTGLLLEAANLFKDLCSIVVAICNKAPSVK